MMSAGLIGDIDILKISHHRFKYCSVTNFLAADLPYSVEHCHCVDLDKCSIMQQALHNDTSGGGEAFPEVLPTYRGSGLIILCSGDIVCGPHHVLEASSGSLQDYLELLV